MKVALLIPVYQPNEKVLPFLSLFQKEEFDAFLLVDDGSGDAYSDLLLQIQEKTVFDLLTYSPNKGKGHALKKGIAYLRETIPDLDYIITADADGQHLRADILALRDRALQEDKDALLLGSRDFKAPDVPERSKIGNSISHAYLIAASGRNLPDSQTGLRGIPSSLFEWAEKAPGQRYEYEMAFLVQAITDRSVVSIPIATVYEDGNSVSHFQPIRDTIRIYKWSLFRLLAALVILSIDGIVFHYLRSCAFSLFELPQAFLAHAFSFAFASLFGLAIVETAVIPYCRFTRMSRIRAIISDVFTFALSYLVMSALLLLGLDPSISNTVAVLFSGSVWILVHAFYETIARRKR